MLNKYLNTTWVLLIIAKETYFDVISIALLASAYPLFAKNYEENKLTLLQNTYFLVLALLIEFCEIRPFHCQICVEGKFAVVLCLLVFHFTIILFWRSITKYIFYLLLLLYCQVIQKLDNVFNRFGQIIEKLGQEYIYQNPLAFGVQIRQHKYVHGIPPLKTSHRR